jgi:dGTPase
MMEGMGGFEHNLQSLRVVEVLEDKYPGFQGLNLTWETREGIAKHSSSCDNPSYAHLKEYNPETVPTLEAQIINLADEIAYNNHDIDDALEAGFTSFEELRGVGLCEKMMLKVEKQFSGISEQKKKYQTISTLIGYLINDVVRYSLENIKQNRIEAFEDVKAVNRILVSYSKQADEQTAELKAFLQKNVYQHYKVERMRVKAERYVTLLFSTFKDNPTLLPQKYRERIEIESKERVICDYIAGMTDRYALDEYKKLFEPYERV